MKVNQFLFILGRGRSGSTLLSSILNVHPSVSVAAETPVFYSLKKKYDNKDITNLQEELLELTLQDHRVMVEAAWDLSKEKLQLLLEESKPQNIDDYIATVIASTKLNQRVKWIGQKFPSLSLRSKMLAKLYPTGKFILLVRNPYDNVASYQKTKFESSNNTGFLAKRWEQFNAAAISNIPPHQLYILKYEDFVEQPELSLAKIADFIGIAFLEGWLDANYVNPVFKEHPFYKRIHDSISKPIGNEHIAKWKNLINAEDVSSINAICSKQMMKLNYGIENVEASLNFNNRIGSLRATVHSQLESISYQLPIALRNKLTLMYFKNRKML